MFKKILTMQYRTRALAGDAIHQELERRSFYHIFRSSETSDVGNAFPPDVTATSLPHPESPSLERHKIDRIAGPESFFNFLQRKTYLSPCTRAQ